MLDKEKRNPTSVDVDTTVLSSDDAKQHQLSILDSLQQGLILFLHRISRAKATSWSWLLALMFFDGACAHLFCSFYAQHHLYEDAALQVLYIPLSSQTSMPWFHSPMMRDGIYVPLLYVTFIPGAAQPEGLNNVYTSKWLFVAAALFAVIMLGSAVACIAAEARLISYRSSWLFRLCSLGTHAGLYALAIPLIASLMAPWSTTGSGSSHWMDADVMLFSGEHISMIVIGTLLLVCTVAYLALVAWVCVDRVPDHPTSRKRNLLAGAHGRVTLAVLLIKVFWICLWLFGGYTNQLRGYGYVILVCVGAVVYLYLQWWYLPYYCMLLNQLYVALASVIVAACVAAIIGLSRDEPDIPTLVLIVLVPVAAYAGYSATDIRQRKLMETHRKFNDSTFGGSSYLLELVCRLSLFEGLESHPSVVVVQGSQSMPAACSDTAPSREHTRGLSSTETQLDGQCDLIVPPDVANGRSDDWLLPRGDARAEAIISIMNFARASMQSGAAVDLILANFAKYGTHNRHIERIYLRSAESKAEKSAWDVHAFVRFRLLEMEDEEELAAGNRMTVAKRMEFEELFEQSSSLVVRGHSQILQYWTALQDKSPDLARLTYLGSHISSNMFEGHQMFQKLMNMAPQSTSVLRAYADFLLKIANDSKKAAELLSDAEQIEDEQSKARAQAAELSDVLLGMLMPEFDLSIDNTCIVRVSARAASMGMIVDANTSALKMLGYNKREVAGKDVNVVVPEPIAEIHPMLLENYTRDGKEVIINTSRIYFIQHRVGYIFPARVHVRPMADEWAAICEEVHTSQSFIWFLGKPSGWRITAVCKSALTSLNLDAQAVRAGSVSMLDVLPDFERAIAEMRKPGCAARFKLAPLSDSQKQKCVLLSVSGKLQIMRIVSLADTLYILRYATVFDSQLEQSGKISEDALLPSDADVSSVQNACEDAENDGAGGFQDIHSARSRDRNLAARDHYQGDIKLCPVMRSLPPEQQRALSSEAGEGLLVQERHPRPVRGTSFSPDCTSSHDAHFATDHQMSKGVHSGTPLVHTRSSAHVNKPGPGSVHSKSSGGSTSSMSEVLRRGVSAKNSKPDSSLYRLKWSIKIIFANVCLLSIISLIVTASLFQQLQENMTYVDHNGERGRYLQASYAAAMRMTMFVEGKYNLTREGVSGTDARMKYNLDQLEAYHKELYLAVDGTLAAETALYTNASLPVEDLVPGSYVSRGNYTSKVRYINLANAGLEYLAKARQFLDLPVADRVMSHPIVFWVNVNGWLGVRDGMNASMMLSFARSSTQADTISTTNVIVVCVVAALLAVVGLFVVLPAIFYVNASQQAVFEVFLQVPPSIVKALRDQSAVVLQSIKRAEEEDDDRGFEERAGGEQEQDGDNPLAESDPLKMALNTLMNKQNLSTDEFSDPKVSKPVVFSLLWGCQRSNNHSHGRRYKNLRSSQFAMIGKMFWPIVLIFAYFTGTFFWKQSVVQAAEYTKAETLWSKQMEFYVPQVAYGPRISCGYCDHDITMYAIMRTRRAVAFVDAIQSSCVDNNHMYYDMHECRQAFMEGFLSKVGLRAALTEYLQIAKQVMDDREAQLQGSNCSFSSMTTGLGYQISQLGDFMLLPAFHRASEIRFNEGMTALNSFMSLDIALTVMLLLALVVLYWVVYLPIVAALDLEMKRCRELLLLFPDEVARAIPAVIQAGRDMMSSAGRVQ